MVPLPRCSSFSVSWRAKEFDALLVTAVERMSLKDEGAMTGSVATFRLSGTREGGHQLYHRGQVMLLRGCVYVAPISTGVSSS